MKSRVITSGVLAGAITAVFMTGAVLAGEVSKGTSSKVSKTDVFKSDTSINLFVSDVGILTEEEIASVKRNLFIEVLKADIKKNENKS